MRAIRQYEFGGPSVLRYEEVPDPVPEPSEVLIEVEACGVHLIDASLRSGRRPGPPLPSLPSIPGREVAGVVAGTGWRVVAHLGPTGSGYASLAVAPESALHPIPDAMSPADAVALVGTGRTALAVLDDAAITPADVVLVPGAAGGLGTLLTQAASAAGAMVVGLVGGPAKAAHVTADVVIDYSAPDWISQVPDATVLLDGTGGAIGKAPLRAGTPRRAGGPLRLVLRRTVRVRRLGPLPAGFVGLLLDRSPDGNPPRRDPRPGRRSADHALDPADDCLPPR